MRQVKQKYNIIIIITFVIILSNSCKRNKNISPIDVEHQNDSVTIVDTLPQKLYLTRDYQYRIDSTLINLDDSIIFKICNSYSWAIRDSELSQYWDNTLPMMSGKILIDGDTLTYCVNSDLFILLDITPMVKENSDFFIMCFKFQETEMKPSKKKKIKVIYTTKMRTITNEEMDELLTTCYYTNKKWISFSQTIQPNSNFTTDQIKGAEGYLIKDERIYKFSIDNNGVLTAILSNQLHI